MKAGWLLIAALYASAFAAGPVAAQEERIADPVRQKTITADLSSCAKPVWPQESLRREEKGAVTLAFLIGLDGAVLESKVEKSSGFALLDLAARDGLEKCKFTPPSQIGRTEPQWTRMMYVWTLTAQDAAKVAAERAKIFADAAAGDADAQFKAAGLRMNVEPKDREAGVALLRQAANQGHARAQEYLAYTLMAENPEEAETWLRKAAGQNVASAQFGLSLLLQRQGSEESSDWLMRATGQGYAPAQRHMASGLLAANAEPERAVRLLQTAADKQDRGAQYLLGTCYEEGKGVPQDRKKAMDLYERASAGGVNEARVAIARLRSVAP